MAGELHARIGVDLDRRLLPRDHAADVLLLEVCLDPRRPAVNQRQHSKSRHGHLPDLKVVGILDHAVHRRSDFGPRQVELGLVHRRLRLRNLRLIAGSESRVCIRGTSSRVG